MLGCVACVLLVGVSYYNTFRLHTIRHLNPHALVVSGRTVCTLRVQQPWIRFILWGVTMLIHCVDYIST